MQEKNPIRTSPTKVPNSEWVDCENCKGTGMHPKEEFILCPTCEGQCGAWVVVGQGSDRMN